MLADSDTSTLSAGSIAIAAGTAVLAVVALALLDVTVALIRSAADSRRVQLVTRRTRQPVTEVLPLWTWVQVVAAFGSATGRLLCSTPQFREFLRADTRRQASKWDSTTGDVAGRIVSFVSDYKIDTSELRDPVDSFASLNAFFYRHLKPEARPIAAAADARVAVQPADCRLTAFASVGDATRLWIKGSHFSVRSLLGCDDAVAERYAEGGSVVVCRLAPDDYHRFHVPVACTWSRDASAAPAPSGVTELGDDFLTVKPLAIKSPLDVLTRNVRQVVWLHTREFGVVAYVIVGAVHVGSIVLTAPDGALHKGAELGHFAFGGSTLVVLFERGAIDLDEDLLQNSAKGIETVVRMGDTLGTQGAGVGVADAGARVASEDSGTGRGTANVKANGARRRTRRPSM